METTKRMHDVVVTLVPLSMPVDVSSLSPGERALVTGAIDARRARELSAGRWAARLAFLEAGVATPPAVLRAFDGRPRLDPPLPGWFVSLAHDGALAAAAVAQTPVGVDVLVASRFDSAARVVAHRVETGRAVSPSPHERCPWPDAALCWTAWEALGKYDGRGVLPAMRRPLTLRPKGDGVEGECEGLRLRWWSQHDALLCVVTGP